LRVFLFIAIIFGALGLAQHAFAQSQAGGREFCNPDKPTTINVIPSTKDVTYDYSLDLAGLQHIHSDTVNPFGFHQRTQTRGLMRGAIQIPGPEISFRIEPVDPRGEYICVFFDEITIELKIEPEIVIAKEVAADPCMHKVTREHELEHVMIDRRLVNKYARVMGEKVNEALKQRGYGGGPFKHAEKDQVFQSMGDVVFKILNHEQKKMFLERNEQQQALDSLDEYKRISAACPGFQSDGP